MKEPESVRQMIGAVAEQTGFGYKTVKRVLLAAGAIGNGVLILPKPEAGPIPDEKIPASQIRLVQETDWVDDDGESRSYQVYTESDEQ